jgi:hypothetical protein
MRLPRIRKRDRMDRGIWYVFNRKTEDEFAECSVCGREVLPEFIAGEDVIGVSVTYPERCPGCGETMTGTMTAEDVDAEAKRGAVDG